MQIISLLLMKVEYTDKLSFYYLIAQAREIHSKRVLHLLLTTCSEKKTFSFHCVQIHPCVQKLPLIPFL